MLGLLVDGRSSAAQSSSPAENPPPAASIQLLIDATTVPQLDRDFRTVEGDRHPALRALYRQRRLALSPTTEEEARFLESLPRSRDEVISVNSLLDERPLSENVLVQRTVYGMVHQAAELAHRHHTAHQRVFELCLWSDGEIAEITWDDCRWLLEQDPEESLAAFKRLPPADLKRVCDPPDVSNFTPRDAVAKCISGE